MLKGGYLNDTKNPDCSGFFASSRERVMKPLTSAGNGSIVDASKQLQPAMTFQVYTKSINRRNPIGKTYALVFLRRLHGLLVAPYVQHKTTLRLKGGSLELEDFPQGVVTRSDSANVKVFTVDYCQ